MQVMFASTSLMCKVMYGNCLLEFVQSTKNTAECPSCRVVYLCPYNMLQKPSTYAHNDN